jgi:hypothetical protein
MGLRKVAMQIKAHSEEKGSCEKMKGQRNRVLLHTKQGFL